MYDKQAIEFKNLRNIHSVTIKIINQYLEQIIYKHTREIEIFVISRPHALPSPTTLTISKIV